MDGEQYLVDGFGYSPIEITSLVSGANRMSISHRCHPMLVAFVWELTNEIINLPLGCLQGGADRRRDDRLGRAVFDAQLLRRHQLRVCFYVVRVARRLQAPVVGELPRVGNGSQKAQGLPQEAAGTKQEAGTK